ncbi:general stress protein [Curtobacterium sp. MCPF17_046]|uniref:general stress protein n=1 Tax=Curtobacterium sp. MCPF17_046 TaxID=2175663 RepID=UPI000D86EB68|nr:general stress protein [Curtobacterium sp. MCPF17_046]PYY38204.1 hypothetical protein DEJ32_10900 [Curtobacterium sp. MCPF17_046]
MSTQSPFGGRTAQAFPTLPRGDVLGTYDSYPEAQRVVAKLAESDFPVAKLSIVGNDLKTVERVTGKMTYGRAALAGALSGLWLGFFFGIVLTLFSPQAGGLFLPAAVIGAGFGMLYGIVSFAITKRQRDFTSIHQVLATTYQIVVDPQLSGQAQRILGQGGAIQHTSWDQPNAGGYGGQPGPGQKGQDQLGQRPGQQQWRPGPGGVPPQQGQYGQPGQYGAGQPGAGQPGQYGQPGPYGQPGGGAGAGQPPQYGQPGAGQPGQYGQPSQQQWRPGGAPQGSPYGGHATPHQPGGPAQSGGPARPGDSAQQQGGDGSSRPDDTRGQAQAGPRYGTNDGPRYGTNDGGARTAPTGDPAPGAGQRSTAPRYGTNEGAARTPDADATADQTQRPSAATRSYGTSDGPRYGEQAPAPSDTDGAADDTNRREDDDSRA